MKKNFLIIMGLALVCAFPTFSQSDNTFELITESRDLSAFDAIHVTGRFKIVLTDAPKQSVKVTVPDKFLETVETTVRNGELTIQMIEPSNDKGSNVLEGLKAKYNDYLIRQPIEIHVGVSNLKSIIAKGTSRIETTGSLNVSNLNVELNGASKARLKADIGNNLTVSLSEAAKLDIDGTAKNLDITANGAASYNGNTMLAKHVKVELNGASRAEVYADDSFDAVLNGATKVVCSGSPKSIKQQASRGSSITIN
ncbi:MAG: head GIN domain-containing protein [Paludibacteraceae bacterium]